MKRKDLFLAAIIFIYILSPCTSYGQSATEFKDLTVGQRLTYLISWNGIPVGTVSTKVEGITELQGRKAYRVVLHAKTNRWASLIYNIDDSFESFIDYETSNSLRHEVVRSEGRYRKKAVIEYIYDRFLAEYSYLKDGRKKIVEVSSYVQDPLSAAYYFLRVDLKEGDEIDLDIDLNEKSYKLCARIEKGKKLRIPGMGNLETLIIRPYVQREGKPYRRGSGYAYLTIKERLPIFAVVRVFIWGTFSATLLPQLSSLPSQLL